MPTAAAVALGGADRGLASRFAIPQRRSSKCASRGKSSKEAGNGLRGSRSLA